MISISRSFFLFVSPSLNVGLIIWAIYVLLGTKILIQNDLETSLSLSHLFNVGHPWYSGSGLDCWSTGRTIHPAPWA